MPAETAIGNRGSGRDGGRHGTPGARLIVLSLIGGSLWWLAPSGSTAAADPHRAAVAPASPTGSSADRRDEARTLAPGEATLGASVQAAHEHVRRGMALYDEGDLGGAHAELERAYDLAPSFKLLYNLAQISLRQQDYVTAARELRAYLAGGREAIAPSRKREVDETLSQLARRTAQLEIVAPGHGARVVVDQAAEVGLPLTEPLTVNVGRHSVTVTWPAGERLTKSVEVASGDLAALRFDPPASVSRSSDVGSLSVNDPDGAARVSEKGESSVLLRRSVGASSSGKQAPARHWPVWTTWAGAGLAGAGAAVAGTFALRASRELAANRMSYPVDAGKLDLNARRTREYALTADIFSAAAILLTGAALYLSF